MLKQRLEATENALLRLLSAADDRTIAAAFGNDEGSDVGDDSSRISSKDSSDMPGSAEVKKAALTAHWDRFPLRTADDLKRWANEVRRSPHSVATFHIGGTSDTGLGVKDSWGQLDMQHYNQPLQVSVVHEGMPRSDVQIEDIHGQGHGGLSGHGLEAVASNHEQPELSAKLQHPFSSTSPHQQPQDKAYSLDLSQDFKQQYLW